MFDKRPVIIAGPCSIESKQQTLTTCSALAASGRVDILRGGIWKPRTMPGGFEGRGQQGLRWLVEAKKLTGLPIAIEVATSAHVDIALRAGVDIVWLGARTTGNPFSVQEIADSLCGVNIPVMIKNPLNPDINLWNGAVERISKAGIGSIALIHRGFSGFSSTIYRNAPLWHLALEMRRRVPNLPMICDPSHICGQRDLLFEVAQQAADLNFEGLIIESHCAPDTALSDSEQQLTPVGLKTLLDSLVWRKSTSFEDQFAQKIEQMRQQIDLYDSEIFSLLTSRMAVSEQIGEVKRQSGVTIFQKQRWDEIRARYIASAQSMNLSPDFICELLDAIHLESIDHQNRVMNKK